MQMGCQNAKRTFSPHSFTHTAGEGLAPEKGKLLLSIMQNQHEKGRDRKEGHTVRVRQLTVVDARP